MAWWQAQRCSLIYKYIYIYSFQTSLYIYMYKSLCTPSFSKYDSFFLYIYICLCNYIQWLGKASATPAAPNGIVKSSNYCHNLGLAG